MATRLPLRAASLGLAAALLAGCTSPTGLLYSRTVQPLMTNFDQTIAAESSGSSSVRTLSFYVDVQWGTDGIGAIARDRGIADIYYADVETLRLFRYFRRDRVRIYGRAIEAPEPPGAGIAVIDDDTGQ